MLPDDCYLSSLVCSGIDSDVKTCHYMDCGKTYFYICLLWINISSVLSLNNTCFSLLALQAWCCISNFLRDIDQPLCHTCRQLLLFTVNHSPLRCSGLFNTSYYRKPDRAPQRVPFFSRFRLNLYSIQKAKLSSPRVECCPSLSHACLISLHFHKY